MKDVTKDNRVRRRLAVIGLVGGLAMALLAQHIRYQELGYESLGLERDKRELLEDIGRLEIEEAFYKSPARVGELAASNGMVRPPREAIRTIRMEDSTR